MIDRNKVDLINKYRIELMGIAILLIMLFHSSFNFNNIFIIDCIKRFGYIGVDIFILLSGIYHIMC